MDQGEFKSGDPPSLPTSAEPNPLLTWPASVQLSLCLLLTAGLFFALGRWSQDGVRPPPLPAHERSAPVLDLNRATKAELRLLPGLGDALAQRVVEHRDRHGRFRSLEELRHVAGIGPKTLDRLRPWLFVTFELVDGTALAPLRYRPFELSPPLRALVAEMVGAYETERTDDLPVLLLGLLLARLRRIKGAAPAVPTPAVPAPGLLMRINQLAQRGTQPPTIKELARTLGISPSHLRARFRASCGVSIGRHLRRLRLEQACGMLRLGPQRVSEIAEQCGFTSIYSFSRAFRTAYGVSPLAYRHSGRAAPVGRRERSSRKRGR